MTTPVPTSRKARWAGTILSALLVLALLFSGVLKLAKPASMVEEFARMGWGEHLIAALGIVELVCAIIYAIPRTQVLGAILLTGYLGGAIATHVRIDDFFITQIVLGVLVWLALYLRDPRVRALIPLRS